MNQPSPSPGWYPDPDGGPALRWFNGTDWTYQYQAPTQQFAPPPPAERRFTIHYGFVLLAAFSLLGTVIPTTIMFAAAGDTGSSDTSQAGQDVAGFGAGMAILWLLWGGMWTLIWAAFAINHTLKGRRT